VAERVEQARPEYAVRPIVLVWIAWCLGPAISTIALAFDLVDPLHRLQMFLWFEWWWRLAAGVVALSVALGLFMTLVVVGFTPDLWRRFEYWGLLGSWPLLGAAAVSMCRPFPLAHPILTVVFRASVGLLFLCMAWVGARALFARRKNDGQTVR